MSAGILHTAVSIEAICYERLEHVESWTWSPLGNHVTCTLDRQESDVSKLLVETSNLVIMKPCLVLSGCLQAEVFHKPLVSQEVAGHVSVPVVDERPQAQREQF